MRNESPLVTRFWEKVEVRGPDECWPWLAAIGTHGYGVIGAGGPRTITAHRLSYIIAHGSIPDAPGHHGGVVMHTCDNRWCCNPAHLVSGSQIDNLLDMRSKGRQCKEGMRPECARTAKLNWEKVREIRRRWGEGESKKALCREYGVGHGTIWEIVTNRTWKERS